MTGRRASTVGNILTGCIVATAVTVVVCAAIVVIRTAIGWVL